MEGSSPVTVEDIARKVGLSQTTVSLVLAGRAQRHRISPATARRVLDAAEAMHYRPNPVARQLAGKPSNLIGVLISTEATADVRLIQPMEIMAAQRGIRFLVGHAVGPPEKVKAYLEDFRGRGVDSIISIFHNHPDFAEVVLPELEHFPNVVYFEKPALSEGAEGSAWYVEPDYYGVGVLGVQHLLALGRRRIAEVLNNRTFSYAIHRHRAYVNTLGSAGRDPDAGLIWIMDEQPGVRWTDPFTDELALQAVDALVIKSGADGIVAVNDLYAARLVRALHARGRRVPEDVAIIGCDNQEYGELVEPPLTTFDLGGIKLAEMMMELVFARLEGRELPQAQCQRVVPPQLVNRGTA